MYTYVYTLSVIVRNGFHGISVIYKLGGLDCNAEQSKSTTKTPVYWCLTSQRQLIKPLSNNQDMQCLGIQHVG